MSTEDLASWLTAVWDEEERLAERYVVDVETMRVDNYGHLTVPARWVLARIAADRKILALHRIDVRKIDHPPFDELTGERWADAYDVICRVCGWAAEDPTSACETVRLLASPYADHPGFRPEWLVERQGVEQ